MHAGSYGDSIQPWNCAVLSLPIQPEAEKNRRDKHVFITNVSAFQVTQTSIASPSCLHLAHLGRSGFIRNIVQCTFPEEYWGASRLLSAAIYGIDRVSAVKPELGMVVTGLRQLL